MVLLKWVEITQIGVLVLTDKILVKYGLPEHVGAVGDGWAPIVERLIKKLIKLGWDKDLRQLKEKFGSLRFYVGDRTPEMNKAIHDAEAKSYATCEECGEPGRPRRGSWILTLCDKHHRANLRRKLKERKLYEQRRQS